MRKAICPRCGRDYKTSRDPVEPEGICPGCQTDDLLEDRYKSALGELERRIEGRDVALAATLKTVNGLEQHGIEQFIRHNRLDIEFYLGASWRTFNLARTFSNSHTIDPIVDALQAAGHVVRQYGIPQHPTFAHPDYMDRLWQSHEKFKNVHRLAVICLNDYYRSLLVSSIKEQQRG